ncbi:hypothetical protein Q5P01_006296 [Channa striata]|uniref:Chemokine interleukin-8-like domain-containing protein n=1 Tax=Channa striata TaxID=64152 RepID=A0AA88NAS5_CHASR|nr:hypothetical protein Q5P01_006296 [Channa striata]
MKILVVLLLVICIVHRSAGSQRTDLVTSDGCCKDYSPVRVPKGRIRNVVMIPSHCGHRAIVVTTVCEKKVCIKLNSDWARTVLDEFQKSTANNKPPSAPFNVFQCNNKKQ